MRTLQMVLSILSFLSDPMHSFIYSFIRAIAKWKSTKKEDSLTQTHTPAECTVCRVWDIE